MVTYTLRYREEGETHELLANEETVYSYLEKFNELVLFKPYLNVSFAINGNEVVSRRYPELAHWMGTRGFGLETIVYQGQKEQEFYRQISELEV